MFQSRPFAYNSGSTINGATQLGNIAIGTATTIDYSTNPGGVKWWNGPDESSGYVVAYSDSTFSQPTPVGINAGVGFWRSSILSDSSFVSLAEYISRYVNSGQTFASGNAALTWLNNNNFWSSYTGGGGSTWTLNFTGGDCGQISCSTNTQTIPENVTLYFEVTYTDNAFSSSINKNGTGADLIEFPNTSTTVSFNTNDTLTFNFSGIFGTGTMTIKETNSSGRLISSFPIFVQD